MKNSGVLLLAKFCGNACNLEFKPLNALTRQSILKNSGVVLIFAGCLLLPLVPRFILRLPDLVFTNFTDAVFYLSYSQNFRDLFLRYGFIYYASRFGAILPDAIAFSVLGPTDGPIYLRLLMACVVSGALFWIGKTRYGLATGIFASLLWSFQPVFARLWVTTYLDSTAVPFLILAVGLILIFAKSSAAAFFSGVLFALSTTSHLYVAILVLCMVPLVIGWRWHSMSALLKVQLPWMVGGFIFTITCAYYWYSKNCGVGAFWQPTVELMSDLSSGGAELWKKRFLDALFETPLWLSPFPFIVWATFFWKKSSPALKGALTSLFLSNSFFWAGDLIGGAYALSMPFYFTFLGPVFLFFFIVFLGEFNAGLQDGIGRSAFFLMAVTIVCLPMVLRAQTQIPWFIVILVLLALAIFVIGKATFFGLSHFYALLCFLSFSMLTLASGFYAQFLADVRISYSQDKKIPSLALKLKEMLPPASKGDIIRFWYLEDENPSLKMLQSFFLHTFSLLPGEKGFAQYPNLSAKDADAIRCAGIQQIVLLDNNPERLSEALMALKKAGLKFTSSQWNELKLGKETIFCQRVELALPSLDDRVDLPLGRLESSTASTLSWSGDRVVLTTSDRRWNFDLVVSLEGLSSHANALHFNAKVLKGRIEVCLLDEQGQLISNMEIWPTDEPVSRTLYAKDQIGKSRLMIRNKMPDSAKSKVEIMDLFLCTTESK